MDPELRFLLLMIGLATAASIVFVGSYFRTQRALRPWVERGGHAPLDPEIRSKYGILVQMGWAGAGAVHEDHRAAYRAFRRELLAGLVIAPNLTIWILLRLAGLFGFRS